MSLRALRERVGRRPPRDLYERFLLACLEISNIVLGFSYASRQRRFRSHARALFTLPRVNKVRLRTGLLSHLSSIITLLCSAQNDAYRGRLAATACFCGSSGTSTPTSMVVSNLSPLILHSALCILHLICAPLRMTRMGVRRAFRISLRLERTTSGRPYGFAVDYNYARRGAACCSRLFLRTVEDASPYSVW